MAAEGKIGVPSARAADAGEDTIEADVAVLGVGSAGEVNGPGRLTVVPNAVGAEGQDPVTVRFEHLVFATDEEPRTEVFGPPLRALVDELESVPAGPGRHRPS